jgi:hypothetical protein
MARGTRSPAKEGPSTDEDVIFEVTLSVLGYREAGEWVALALELDLRGFGATFHEAVEDLRDLVRMQVSFAHFKGQPEMVWKPAEGVWWGLFQQVRRDFLEASVRERQPSEDDYSIAEIRIPPAHEIASFSQADA